VRLTGDGSNLSAMYARAQQETTQTTNHIQRAGQQIQQVSTNVTGFAQAAAGALATIGVGLGLKGLLDTFISMEKNTIRLSAAIEVNKGNVETSIAAYRGLAEAISETTLTTRVEVMAMAQRAEMYGLTGAAAERAIRNAVALASATGQDAESMLRATIGMEQGNIQMLRRIPGLRGIHDATQLVAKANQLMAAGMKAAEAETNSLGGQIHHLWEEMKRLTLPLGEDLAKLLKPVVTVARQAVDWFNNLSPTVRRAVTVVVGVLAAIAAIGPALMVLGPFIGAIVTGFKIVLGIVAAIFSPIGALVVLIGGVLTAVVYRWVQSVGGVGAAWEIMKTKAVAAWDWIQRKALQVYAFIKPGLNTLVDWIVTAWDKVGEWGMKAWEWIQEKAAAFYAWIRPIALAWFGFFKATWGAVQDVATIVWTAIKSAAGIAWEQIKSIFRSVDDVVTNVFGGWKEMFLALIPGLDLFGGSIEEFGDNLRDAFIMGEFALQNFGQVWGVIVAGIKWKWAELTNLIGFFFTSTIPAGLNYFQNNWAAVWRAAFDLVIMGFNELSLPQLIERMASGEGVADIGNRIRNGIANATRNLPPLNLPVRVPPETENRLRREFEALSGQLAEDFATFYARRIAEINALDPEDAKEEERKEKRKQDNQPPPWIQAATKAIEKFDAAIVGSAEHVSRLFNYRLFLAGQGGVGIGSSGGGAGESATSAFNFNRGGAGAASGTGTSQPGGTPAAPTPVAAPAQPDLRPILDTRLAAPAGGGAAVAVEFADL
jgi:hypothetical protein